MWDVWFESWERVRALAVAAVAAYGWLVVTLRVSGKPTLARLRADEVAVGGGDGIGPDAIASERAVRRLPELLRSLAVRRSDVSRKRERCL